MLLKKEKSLLLHKILKKIDLNCYYRFIEIDKIIKLLIEIKNSDDKNLEMKLKIECNKIAKNAFDFIFQIYYENTGNKLDAFKDSSKEYFSSPEKRKKVMIDFVLNNLKSFSNVELFNISFWFEEYFLMEQLINLIDAKIDEKIIDFEDSLLNFMNNKYDVDDFYNYQICLQEAIVNYINKEFSKSFTFMSSDMQNSIHSIETKNGRKELQINLSISYSKVLHLMGLEIPSLIDDKDIESQIFRIYIKEHFDLYNKIINDENLSEEDKKAYLYICFLIDGGYSKYVNNISNFISSNREKIIKSFQKCINFRKTYEFKRIPEIILDYESNDIYGADTKEEDYRYLRNTDAYTPLGDNKSISLSSLIKLDSKLKDGFVLKNGISLPRNLMEFIKKLLDDFDNNLEIRIAWSNGKIKIENNNIRFKVNGVQYKYNLSLNKYRTDDPVNVLLLSYNDENMRRETLLSNCFIRMSFILLAKEIANILLVEGFSATEDFSSINLDDKMMMIESIINKCLNDSSSIDEEELKLLLFDYKLISKYINKSNSLYKVLYNKLKDVDGDDDEKVTSETIGNLREFVFNNNLFRNLKRNKLLDLDIFVGFVNYFMKNSNVELPRIASLFCDENVVANYINKSELDDLVLMTKSYFDNSLASIHSRKTFGITHTNNISSSVEKNNKGEQPLLNMCLKLVEKLKSHYFASHKKRINLFDTPVSMIGFFVGDDREMNRNKKRKYVKTFMGKTASQVLLDLRLNGWFYKLDTIYGEEGDNIIYYSIIPLLKYNKKLFLDYKRGMVAISDEMHFREHNITRGRKR